MLDAKRLVDGVCSAVAAATAALVAGALAAAALVGASALLVVPAAPAAADSASAATLYSDALATTRSWSVHYASSSTEAKKTLQETGNAGPASASQTVLLGKGSISILVIGDISYVKGNAAGLEDLAGLSSSQAAEAAGQWIEFSTDNAAFAPVVAGVRSTDLAKELALKSPLSLGHRSKLDGEAVDAIDGTQAVGKKTEHVVLYVRADGTHVPVEEDSVDAQGRRTDAEHIVYSRWGEKVRPQAPKATISVGSISAV